MRVDPLIQKLREQVREEAKPWLDNMVARNLSPGTVDVAERALLKFLKFLVLRDGPLCLRDVSTDDLEAWRLSLFEAKHAPATIASALGWVGRFYRWTERRGLLFQSPADSIEVPRFVRPMLSVPSEADMGHLLTRIPMRAVLDLRDRALLETAYATGFRLSELAGLNVDSVDMTYSTARAVGKGHRERVVPLTHAAVTVIGLYLKRARPVLLRGAVGEPALWLAHKGGRRMTKAGLHAIFKERAVEAGLDMSPHAVRRAFATHLLHHGATPMDLKLLLGHNSFRHLKHYLRYVPIELIQTHRNSRLGQ